MPKPKPPTHLSRPAKAWWAEIEGDYDLAAHQRLLLSEAASAWDRCAEARAVISEEGLMIGARAHPAIAIERDSRLAFVRILRELNLDVAPPDARPPILGYS